MVLVQHLGGGGGGDLFSDTALFAGKQLWLWKDLKLQLPNPEGRAVLGTNLSSGTPVLEGLDSDTCYDGWNVSWFIPPAH